MKRIVYYIYVYGPESDYQEELMQTHEFNSLKDAEKWASNYIPINVGYKIYKLEQVVNKKPKPPDYLN